MTNLDDYCANSQPGPLIQTLFPLPKDAPYEVWLCLGCLNIVNDDDGERVYCQKHLVSFYKKPHSCNKDIFL